MGFELGAMLTGKFPDFNPLNLVTANPTYDQKRAYSYRGNKPNVSPHRFHFIEYGNGVISVPRNYFKVSPEDIIDHTQHGRKIAVTFNATLRDYQAEYLKHITDNDYIMKVDCGLGKTFMAIHQVAKIGVNTLIIVPSKFLMDQWVQEAVKVTTPAEEWVNEFTWLTGKTPHIVKSSKEWFEGHDIVICTYNMASRLTADKLKGFGCVIFDEVHHCGSQTAFDILYKIPAKNRIGLTATPIREDNAHTMLHYNFQKMWVMANPYPKSRAYFVNTNYSVNTKMVTGYCGLDDAAAFDTARTKQTMEIIDACLAAGRKPMVLSKRIEALRSMASHYKGSALVISENTQVKGFNKWVRTGEAPLYFGIMQIAKEGFDVDSIDTIIFHLPIGHIQQPIGRILRIKEGKKKPLAILLNDDVSTYRKVWLKAINNGGHFNYAGEVEINQINTIL